MEATITLILKVGACVIVSVRLVAESHMPTGDQDTTKLAPGQERSAKHRKAEEMIMKGAEIRILCESDFLRLVE